MKKEKFRGMTVVIGCCIHVGFALGFSCVYLSAYSLLSEAYGINMAIIGTLVSMMSAFGFAGMLAANTLIKKISSRMLILFGAGIIFIYGLLAAFVPGFIGFAVAMSISGLITAFSGAVVANDIISRWYVEKLSSKLGMVMASTSFGLAIFNGIGGFVFNAFGVRMGFLVLAIVTAAVLVINSFTLLRYLDPKEIGQYPDGKDTPPDESPLAGSTPVNTESKGGLGLYKKPAFWMITLAAAFNGVYVSYVYQYSTAYLTAGGIQYTTATTLLSAMGMISALFVLVSGRILEKLKLRKYLTLVFVFAVLCNISVLLFLRTASVPAIAAIILGYTLGYPSCSATTYVVYQLAKPENCVNIVTKTGAALMVSNVIMAPLFGAIVDNWGYNVVYIIATAVCVLGYLIYQLLISNVNRNGQI